jgi:hypothetical protein
MTTVQEIEKAVRRLPERDLDSFRSWFEEFDARAWDKQFEHDIQSGRLDALADQAVKDLKTKRCARL